MPTWKKVLVEGAVAINDLSDVTVSSASSAQILVHDGTDSFDNVSVSGDVTITTAGAVTIGDDKVDNDKLANITRGSVKVGGASNAPTDLVAKASGQILVGDGTDVVSVAVSGDVALSAAGVVTIQSDAVEFGMLNDNVISGQTALAVAPAGSDELLLSDNGVLKRVTVTNFSAALSDDLHADDLTFAAGTTAGPVITVVMSDTSQNITAAAIPSAAVGASGVVNTGAQEFGGVKTFNDNVIFESNITVEGDLNLTGDLTSTSTTELLVEDKTILIAKGAASAGTANNAGIIVDTSGLSSHAVDAKLNYLETGTTFSEWQMVKGEGASPKATTYIAGMAYGSDNSTLIAIDAGVGSLGWDGTNLHIQTA